MPFDFSSAPAEEPPRFVLVIQYPFDQKVKLPLYRTGAMEKIDGDAVVRRKKSTQVKVDLQNAPPPSSVKPEYRAYVLWAVDAKGRFAKLGALENSLDIETPLQSFGLVVSLEADAQASQPKGLFVLESHLPDKRTRYFGMLKVVYAGQPEGRSSK